MLNEDENNKSLKRASDSSLSSGFELTDKMLDDDFEEAFKNYPLNDDTTCGFGRFRGSFLQR